jgi:hypothetical protein
MTNLTFPVKSKIQQCKLLDALSGKALRNNSLDREKYILGSPDLGSKMYNQILFSEMANIVQISKIKGEGSMRL